MISRYYLILFLTVLSFVSCNKYLDETPDSKYGIEIDDVQKVREIITSAYPKASYFPFLEARTDNVSEREGAVNKNRLNENMFFWQDNNADEPDTPLYYWNECYKGIAEVNHTLENLKKFPNKTEEIKALYGEALVLRAYLHFMLVNIWSEPYNPSTADTDLGIPYLTKPEKNALPDYERGTVAQTYGLIKKDLEIGLGLINDKFYKQPKYHFNKDAAYAFASRFYLYIGDWDKVILLADHILGLDPFSKLKDWGIFSYASPNYDSNARVSDLYSKEHPSNLLFVSTESRWNRNYKNEKYGLDFSTSRDLFTTLKPSNLKPYLYYNAKLSGVRETTAKYIDKFKDFATFESVDNDYRGVFMDNIIFTTDEVYLNKIEALIMKEEYNQAFFELRTYTKAKVGYTFVDRDVKYAFSNGQDLYNSAFGPLTFFQASMLAFVAELRRREFVHEGLRWFDIRRFYLSVNRNSNGEFLDLSKILKKNDTRKVLQIPNDAIKYGLTSNPR